LGLVLAAAASLAAPPVANDDSATTRSGPTAGLEVFFNVAANDSDPDGDTLDYVLSQPPANGSAVVGPSGTARYTPNAGFVGTDYFEYQVSDGVSLDTAVVTITVNANQNPVATDDSVTAGSWPTDTAIPVLANDSDPDGDVLAYRDLVLVDQPQNGFVEISCLGACSPPRYRPNNGFAGTDSFTYRAGDELGGESNLATVTITVNGPPVASNDVGESLNGQPVLVDVLANDSDPNLDSLTASVATPPTGGTAQVTTGGILYTPNPGFQGPESFTYVASDGVLQSAPATVTIVFAMVSQPPTAVDDQVFTSVDTPVRINVLDNDTDPDNVPADLSIASVTQPQNGSAVISGRQIEYTPASGFVGTDTFDYVVTDMVDGSDIGTVTVTVVAGNVPPTAVIAGGNRSVPDSDGVPGEPITVDGSGSFDPDGETIIFYEWSVNGVIDSAAISATETFDIPDGASTISLRVYDDQEAVSTPASVTITVSANSPPVAVIAGGNRTVADSNQQPGEAVPVDGSGSADSDGTISTYRWSVNGQVVAGATGANPSLALADGPSTVALVVTDDAGAESAPASVVITVAAANPGPTVTIAGGDRQIPDGDNLPGELVPFEGSATDAGGPVAASTFRWSVNGNAIAAANGQANPTLALGAGANVVTLAAADSLGAVGSDSVTVTIGEPNQISELPGLTENQQSTAEATESVCSTLLKTEPASLTEEQRNLSATCDTLFAASGSPEAVGEALDQISGEQVTAQQTTAIDFSSAQLLNVGARLRALRMGAKGFSTTGLNMSSPEIGAPVSAIASLAKVLVGEGGASGDDEGGLLDSRLGIFMNGSLRWGNKDATTRESGFDFDSLGVTLGGDYRFTDSFVAGLALGYASADVDFDSRGGSQDSASYSGSLYGSWYGDSGYIDTIVSYGQVDYDMARNIEILNLDISDTALGETDGTQWAVGLGTGYDFGTGALRFGPTGSISYIRVDVDGFTERTTGTSGLAMRFADQTGESLMIKVGAQAAYVINRKWGILSPQARFDFVHEMMNDAQLVTVRFANSAPTTGPGQPVDSFVILTDNPDRNFFNWAVGLAATFTSGFSGFVDYESVAGLDTITSQELSFGLRYEARFR
jgi:outer membrane autotransporter protein